MKNNKGFVMTETLVVTVFLVTIFTFIYISIVPLIGKYEDLVAREGDIDIIYKLYNIRKFMLVDPYKDIIIEPGKNTITCNSFSDTNREYCNKMMEYLELDNYILVYVDDIYDNLGYIKSVSEEMYDYILQYDIVQSDVLILLDQNKHTIGYLSYDGVDYGVPTNYGFGDTTILSPTAPPDGKNVYIGTYNDEYRGVCISTTSGQHCFKVNNWNVEKKHLQKVLGVNHCNVEKNKVECSNSNLGFACRGESDGYIECLSNTSRNYCNISSDYTVTCISNYTE